MHWKALSQELSCKSMRMRRIRSRIKARSCRIKEQTASKMYHLTYSEPSREEEEKPWGQKDMKGTGYRWALMLKQQWVKDALAIFSCCGEMRREPEMRQRGACALPSQCTLCGASAWKRALWHGRSDPCVPRNLIHPKPTDWRGQEKPQVTFIFYMFDLQTTP